MARLLSLSKTNEEHKTAHYPKAIEKSIIILVETASPHLSPAINRSSLSQLTIMTSVNVR